MKVAIHHRKGSFSERWIQYCEENNINFKIVDCFDNNIIETTRGCDILLWHYHHAVFEDSLIAKEILFSLEHAGVKVYPNWETQWHFDNKVAQKYLLEAIDAPLVPSYVFYDREKALKWAKSTSYPKVFKLKGGAGSKNVLLVKDVRDCKAIINKAFGKGFLQYTIKNAIKDDWLRFKKTKKSINLLKAFGRIFIKPEFVRKQSREKGYVYFQKFIPNNEFDIRIIVVDGKAFGIKRIVRENDFRASGSGVIIYEKHQIDLECVEIAFKVNSKLNAQSIAFDFVFDSNSKPLIVEISYGFLASAYDLCEGYWDSDLNWYDEKVIPQYWILDNIIRSENKI